MITDVRIESQSQLTKVTVVAEGLFDIKADRLENPDRIFIDFAEMVPQLVGRVDKGPRGAMQAIAGSGRILRQVRVAENQKGVTRLVLDLELADVEY
ncbi:AMIN domain-containing protein, partial [Leclercia adecarboxylata]|uniref:AMIN domain-containing protein n=1 Tax=Leclercia adecarboxylata TaxID=83655 RepID=UPI00234D7FE6